MIVIESVLGNINDPEWIERLSGAHVDAVSVEQWEAQKSRFRKTTAKGTELAISLERGTYIRDGDVLHCDTQAATVVVARINLREVMIVYLDGLTRLAPDVAMRICVELGHAFGNQHWPALAKGNLVYVPLTVDRKVMASVMNTHHLEGIRYEFLPGRQIVDRLDPHELRRLFGGAEGPVHSHTHDDFAVTDAETGRVYGRPPVRALAHSHPAGDAASETSPAVAAVVNDRRE